MRPNDAVIELHAVKIVAIDGFEHQVEQQLPRTWMQWVKPHKTVGRNLTALQVPAEPIRLEAAQVVHGGLMRCHEAVFEPGDGHQPLTVSLGDGFVQKVSRRLRA